MRNVYLFQPQYAVEYRNEINYWMPYSVGCLWSYAQQFDFVKENFTLKDIIFTRKDPHELLEQIEDPILCGFSNYIWNTKYNQYVAKLIKERWPNCVIQFGGPQVNAKTLELPFVDSAVLAEGEESFVKTLESIHAGTTVQELFLKTRLEKLDIPSPYTTGVFDKIVAENPHALWSMIIETNRGCPYACTFCDWGSATYSKVRRFNLDRVADELEWAVKHPVEYLFCADANFGMFKERDLEIAKMIRSAADRGKIKVVNLQFAKNSTQVVFDIAKTIGELSRGVTFSVQSMNELTLDTIKRKNMDVNNVQNLIKIGEQNGVSTYTEAILGLPEETLESWKTGMAEILEMGQHDSIDIYFCQMIENSELNSFESKLTYKPKTTVAYDYLSFTNPTDYQELREEIVLVNSTSTMTCDDMVDGYMYSWLIIQFHICGYTSYYAKYCRNLQNVSYRQYYDELLRLIQADDELGKHYADVRRFIKIYLTEGRMENSIFPSIKAHGHGLHGVSYKYIYDNRVKIMQLAEDAVKKFLPENDVEKIIPQINLVQHNYILDLNQSYPLEIEIPWNILTWEQIPTKYEITSKVKINDISKDFDFHFARRLRQLKNIFTQID